MKKTKIWLVAALLVVIGLIIFVSAMSALAWDYTKLNNTKYETNTHNISGEFKNINIETNTGDVIFLPSDNGECKVVCYEQENLKHSADIDDETLNIKIVDNRKWYDYITFTFSSPKITVYLPKESYDLLVINTDTGSVNIPDGFNFKEIKVSGDTGSVKCRSNVSGLMQIKTSTGDINIDNITAGEMNLSVSTGSVNVKSVNCEGDIKIKVDTGKVQLTDVTCKNLNSNGSTGKISLKNVIASEKLNIKRDTGDVKFTGCDAAEIYIETDTGDVTGTLLSEKVFIVRSDIGSIDVPKTVTGGRCEITTDTGDIKIRIE